MDFNFDVTDKQSVFEYLSTPGNNVNGRLTRECGFARNFTYLYELYKSYKTNNDIDDMPFKQRLWYFLQDLYIPVICQYCGDNITPFNGFKYGHQKYCCMSCMNKDIEHKDNVKKGLINNFGSFDNYIKIRNEKSERTCFEKYGVKNGGGSKESLEKGMETRIKRYGSLEKYNECVRDKQVSTIISRYGSLEEFYKNVAKKRDETNRRNHNGVLYSQTDVGKKCIVEKGKKTNRENFLNRVYENDKNVINISEDNILCCKCYENNCQECDEKMFEIPYHIYIDRKNKGLHMCYKKYNRRRQYAKSISKNEKEVFSFIRTMYDGEILENDRKILDGKEIDIYIPELKIGFEYNGDFWHINPDLYGDGFVNPISHKSRNEMLEYDDEKIKNAKNKNVDLFIIWENDWVNNNEKTMTFIKLKIDERKNRRQI